MLSEESLNIKKGKISVNKVSSLQDSEEFRTAPEGEKKGFFKKSLKFISTLVFVVVVCVAGYSSYELYKLKNPEYQKKLAEKRVKNITDAVGKLMELPSGAPQVAAVSDVDALKKSQPFFEKAVNGDSVLIYSNLAILYRQSTNKIINVAPVTKEQIPAPKEEVKAVLPKASLTVEVRNGTGITGKGKSFEPILKNAGYTVTEVKSAANNNYKSTIVFAKPGIETKGILELVKGTLVNTLPEGEQITNSDILIIIGE